MDYIYINSNNRNNIRCCNNVDYIKMKKKSKSKPKRIATAEGIELTPLQKQLRQSLQNKKLHIFVPPGIGKIK